MQRSGADFALSSAVQAVRYVARSVFHRLRVAIQWDRHQRVSWSQEGEDIILARLFEGQRHGFYVDIGAHHPLRFSNTHLFYRRGWRGINVDALPGSMKPFRRSRARDINLEIGVAAKKGVLEFHTFDEPALNTFSHDIAFDKVRGTPLSSRKGRRQPVKVVPLLSILERYLPEGQRIDFLSVDAEGLDYEILASNDWRRFRPRVVLAELFGSGLDEIAQSNVGQLMREVGYRPYAKTMNTVVFLDAEPAA